MDQDRYDEATAEVDAAAAALKACLDVAVGMLRDSRDRLREGHQLGEVVAVTMARGGRDARLASNTAFDDYERAVTRYRAAVVRALIDEEGMSLTAVGRLLGVSRQMVARLHALATG
jgi:hypothetical protein